MAFITQTSRFLCSVTFVILFILTALTFYPYMFINRYSAKKMLSYITRFYTGLVLKALRFKISITNRDLVEKDVNYLVISNHLSYLDMLILFQVIPCNFVTSIEMKKTLLLGQLSELSGALYVERRSRKNLSSEISDIVNALVSGLSIGIFPEGTTTNGESLLPFKRSLFEAAINAKKDILPVSINYLSVNSQPVTKGNRDNLFWYGDMGFLSHLWNLCSQKTINVNIHISDIIKTQGVSDTKILRDKAFESVNSKYQKI